MTRVKPREKKGQIAIEKYNHVLVRHAPNQRIFCLKCGAALSGDPKIWEMCSQGDKNAII